MIALVRDVNELVGRLGGWMGGRMGGWMGGWMSGGQAGEGGCKRQKIKYRVHLSGMSSYSEQKLVHSTIICSSLHVGSVNGITGVDQTPSSSTTNLVSNVGIATALGAATTKNFSVHARRVAAQSVTPGAMTQITLSNQVATQSNDYLTGGFDNGTSLATIPDGGIYHVVARASCDVNGRSRYIALGTNQYLQMSNTFTSFTVDMPWRGTSITGAYDDVGASVAWSSPANIFDGGAVQLQCIPSSSGGTYDVSLQVSGSSTATSAITTLNANEWYHLGVTWFNDAHTAMLTVNGTSVLVLRATSVSAPSSTATMTWGKGSLFAGDFNYRWLRVHQSTQNESSLRGLQSSAPSTEDTGMPGFRVALVHSGSSTEVATTVDKPRLATLFNDDDADALANLEVRSGDGYVLASSTTSSMTASARHSMVAEGSFALHEGETIAVWCDNTVHTVTLTVSLQRMSVYVPRITLTGSTTELVERLGSFDDAGTYSALEYRGTSTVDITGSVTVTGTVNTIVSGVYYRHYNVSSTSGGSGGSVTVSAVRKIVVKDSTPPTITIVGPSSTAVATGESYSDQGATAVDGVDISSHIVTTSNVDTSTAATYTVTYDVTDEAGNAAHAVRSVSVVEVGANMAIVHALALTLSTNVDYNTFSNSPTAQADFLAAVEQVVASTLGVTPTGSQITSIAPGSTIVGVDVFFSSASDAASAQATLASNPNALNIALGALLNARDAAIFASNTVTGVAASPTITPTVSTIPTITVNGGASVTHEQGNAYTDQGITIAPISGVTFQTTTTSNVNQNVAGTYSVLYTVNTVPAGVPTSVTRTVVVADNTAPTFSVVNPATVTVERDASLTYSDSTPPTATDTGSGLSGGLSTSIVAKSTTSSYTYVVTVALVDGVNRFHLDGIVAPPISLTRGQTYQFDLNDSSLSGHPFEFSNADGTSAYTTGVTGTTTLTFAVPSTAPTDLRYRCTTHGNGMGSTISVIDTALESLNRATINDYEITYSASDNAGNTATTTRVVQVRDTSAASLTINGDDTITVQQGDTYTDTDGASGTDNGDDISGLIQSDASSVDTNTPGDYTVTYRYTDPSGAQATATRTVNVVSASGYTPPATAFSSDTTVAPLALANATTFSSWNVGMSGPTGAKAMTETLASDDGGTTANVAMYLTNDATAPHNVDTQWGRYVAAAPTTYEVAGSWLTQFTTSPDNGNGYFQVSSSWLNGETSVDSTPSGLLAWTPSPQGQWKITFEYYKAADSVSVTHVLMSVDSGEVYTGDRIQINEYNLQWKIGGTGANVVWDGNAQHTGLRAIPIGQWVTIEVTYDGSQSTAANGLCTFTVDGVSRNIFYDVGYNAGTYDSTGLAWTSTFNTTRRLRLHTLPSNQNFHHNRTAPGNRIRNIQFSSYDQPALSHTVVPSSLLLPRVKQYLPASGWWPVAGKHNEQGTQIAPTPTGYSPSAAAAPDIYFHPPSSGGGVVRFQVPFSGTWTAHDSWFRPIWASGSKVGGAVYTGSAEGTASSIVGSHGVYEYGADYSSFLLSVTSNTSHPLGHADNVSLGALPKGSYVYFVIDNHDGWSSDEATMRFRLTGEPLAREYPHTFSSFNLPMTQSPEYNGFALVPNTWQPRLDQYWAISFDAYISGTTGIYMAWGGSSTGAHMHFELSGGSFSGDIHDGSTDTITGSITGGAANTWHTYTVIYNPANTAAQRGLIFCHNSSTGSQTGAAYFTVGDGTTNSAGWGTVEDGPIGFGVTLGPGGMSEHTSVSSITTHTIKNLTLIHGDTVAMQPGFYLAEDQTELPNAEVDFYHTSSQSALTVANELSTYTAGTVDSVMRRVNNTSVDSGTAKFGKYGTADFTQHPVDGTGLSGETTDLHVYPPSSATDALVARVKVPTGGTYALHDTWLRPYGTTTSELGMSVHVSPAPNTYTTLYVFSGSATTSLRTSTALQTAGFTVSDTNVNSAHANAEASSTYGAFRDSNGTSSGHVCVQLPSSGGHVRIKITPDNTADATGTFGKQSTYIRIGASADPASNPVVKGWVQSGSRPNVAYRFPVTVEFPFNAGDYLSFDEGLPNVSGQAGGYALYSISVSPNAVTSVLGQPASTASFWSDTDATSSKTCKTDPNLLAFFDFDDGSYATTTNSGPTTYRVSINPKFAPTESSAYYAGDMNTPIRSWVGASEDGTLRRGWNVLVVDPATNTEVDMQTFDTYASDPAPAAFIAHLTGLSTQHPGKIAMLGACNDASYRMTADVAAQLKSLTGASHTFYSSVMDGHGGQNTYYTYAYAIIFLIGTSPSSPTLLAEDLGTSKTDPVEASASGQAVQKTLTDLGPNGNHIVFQDADASYNTSVSGAYTGTLEKITNSAPIWLTQFTTSPDNGNGYFQVSSSWLNGETSVDSTPSGLLAWTPSPQGQWKITFEYYKEANSLGGLTLLSVDSGEVYTGDRININEYNLQWKIGGTGANVVWDGDQQFTGLRAIPIRQWVTIEVTYDGSQSTAANGLCTFTVDGVSNNIYYDVGYNAGTYDSTGLAWSSTFNTTRRLRLHTLPSNQNFHHNRTAPGNRIRNIQFSSYAASIIPGSHIAVANCKFDLRKQLSYTHTGPIAFGCWVKLSYTPSGAVATGTSNNGIMHYGASSSGKDDISLGGFWHSTYGIPDNYMYVMPVAKDVWDQNGVKDKWWTTMANSRQSVYDYITSHTDYQNMWWCVQIYMDTDGTIYSSLDGQEFTILQSSVQHREWYGHAKYTNGGLNQSGAADHTFAPVNPYLTLGNRYDGASQWSNLYGPVFWYKGAYTQDMCKSFWDTYKDRFRSTTVSSGSAGATLLPPTDPSATVKYTGHSTAGTGYSAFYSNVLRDRAARDLAYAHTETLPVANPLTASPYTSPTYVLMLPPAAAQTQYSILLNNLGGQTASSTPYVISMQVYISSDYAGPSSIMNHRRTTSGVATTSSTEHSANDLPAERDQWVTVSQSYNEALTSVLLRIGYHTSARTAGYMYVKSIQITRPDGTKCMPDETFANGENAYGWSPDDGNTTYAGSNGNYAIVPEDPAPVSLGTLQAGQHVSFAVNNAGDATNDQSLLRFGLSMSPADYPSSGTIELRLGTAQGGNFNISQVHVYVGEGANRDGFGYNRPTSELTKLTLTADMFAMVYTNTVPTDSATAIANMLDDSDSTKWYASSRSSTANESADYVLVRITIPTSANPSGMPIYKVAVYMSNLASTYNWDIASFHIAPWYVGLLKVVETDTGLELPLEQHYTLETSPNDIGWGAGNNIIQKQGTKRTSFVSAYGFPRVATDVTAGTLVNGYFV
jgi:hypothetical protein